MVRRSLVCVEQVALEETAFLALGGSSLASLASSFRMAGTAGAGLESAPASPADSMSAVSYRPGDSPPQHPSNAPMPPAARRGLGAPLAACGGSDPGGVREALLPRCSEGGSSVSASDADGRLSRTTQ